MYSRPSLCIRLGILAVFLSVLPASAHHGWAGNSDEEFELTGTIQTGVSLARPHATMKVLSDGKVWDITLAPPARTEKAGLTEEITPTIAPITTHAHRNRDPQP